MRKQAIKVKLAATFFGLLLFATGAFAAQEGLTKRVRFARGRTTATFKNSVVRGTQDRYTLDARAGQKMSVSITSIERNAVFTIYTPDGGTRGNATYTLKVTVR